MRRFFPGRKRKPSSEQLERLSQITNEARREALLQAIQTGEEIPDYAWNPIPEDVDPQSVLLSIVQYVVDTFRTGLNACAEKARLSADPSSHYLCDAFDAAEVSRFLVVTFQSGHTDGMYLQLMRWGYFNPFGPTTVTINLSPVSAKENLLTMQVDHPFRSQAIVYGLLPGKRELDPALRLLFERNGSRDWPLFIDFPSHVVEVSGAPVSIDQVKELVFAAVQSIDASELDAWCELLQRHRGKPWDRAGIEVQRALSRPEVTKALADIKAGYSSMPASEPTPPVRVTRSQFERWWELVTDRRHVKVEVSEMGKAWNEALRIQEEGWPGASERR